jgi:CSLREA domain-containing protein
MGISLPQTLVMLSLSAACGLLQPTAVAATFTVTSTSDTNPGGDGISLREAIQAANDSPGPHSITFAGSLAGRTIALTSQLLIRRNGIAIEGPVDAGGRPAITLDVNATSPIAIGVLASDISIKHLRFARMQNCFAIWINAGTPGAAATPVEARNLLFEGNEFEGQGPLLPFRTSAITLGTAEGSVNAKVLDVVIARNSFSRLREPAEGASSIHVHVDGQDGLVQNVLIRDNNFLDIDFAVELVPARGSRNRISATQILNNRFMATKQAIAMETSATGATTDNSIEGTLIANNAFTDNLIAVAMYGGIFPTGIRNSILDTQFVGNVVRNHGDGVSVFGGSTSASANRVDGLRIANNDFRGIRGNSVRVVGGTDNGTGNSVQDVQIVNNLISGTTQFGAIEVTGGLSGANGNTVRNVRIINNTLANNSGYAIKLDQNFQGTSGNVISDVVVGNTILWANEFDFGDERPTQVFSSITSAPGFAGVNGNIAADPRFVNAAAGDYRLQAGSPAIRNGSLNNAPYDDLECRMRASPPDIGAYEFGGASRCDGEELNFTALWWNPRESGWGINVNHQGSTLFATLFTYAQDRRPLWLVASSLARQADGSFSGALYRTTGPAFNRVPWTSVSVLPVGAMTLRFPAAGVGALSYTVDGVPIAKIIQKQVFAVPVPKCIAVSGSRAAESNYQDLWWNSQEPGWGINLAHQANTMFATLFTYDASGRDLWLVASALNRQGDGSFAGPLYGVQGPAFDTAPWSPVTATPAGNMSLRFTAGDSGTLNYTYNGVSVAKQITRQQFDTSALACR